MDYLELVNKALDESGKENTPLTLATWSSAEAGKRLYPRLKRLVAEAWKMIQLNRNEWEFNSGEFTTTIQPRMKFENGSRPTAPVAGGTWTSQTSGLQITVTEISLVAGDWADGDAYGQVEFSTTSQSAPQLGETFDEDAGDGTFEYIGPGTYRLLWGPGDVREPRWNTFQARRSGEMYNSMVFVPWNNFILGGLTYAHSRSVPYYFTQDYLGDIQFYGQSVQPFTLSFVYDVAPQTLSDPSDVPTGLPAEYHEWIAWEALKNLARFDKDPDLFAYAEQQASAYRRRAERNLLPNMEWERSRFDYA